MFPEWQIHKQANTQRNKKLLQKQSVPGLTTYKTSDWNKKHGLLRTSKIMKCLNHCWVPLPSPLNVPLQVYSFFLTTLPYYEECNRGTQNYMTRWGARKRVPYDLEFPVLDIYLSEGIKISISKRYLHTHIHCSIIHKSQGMEIN